MSDKKRADPPQRRPDAAPRRTSAPTRDSGHGPAGSLAGGSKVAPASYTSNPGHTTAAWASLTYSQRAAADVSTTAVGTAGVAPSHRATSNGELLPYLPEPVEHARRETFELAGRNLTAQGPVAIELSESRSPSEHRAVFAAHGMATDHDAGVHSGTRFEILERIPPPSTLGPVASDELTVPGAAQAYDVEVKYTRVLVYVDGSGDHLKVTIDGWLGFTTGHWEQVGLIGVFEPASFAHLIDKVATAGSYTVGVTAVGRIGTISEVVTGAETTLRGQYESAASRLIDAVQGPGLAPLEPDPRTGFLAPQAVIGQQNEAARAFLPWYLETVELRLRERLDKELPADLARIKGKLLEERIDGNDEREIIELVRTWSAHRDVLLPSGQSYFDAFLTDLRASSWERDWGLFETGRTSYWTSLFEETEEKSGELASLIGSSSREYGHYVAPWDAAASGRELNPDWTKKMAGQVLGALEGYTSGDDEKIVLETMTGLPAHTQRAVLQEVMSRYDETEYGIFGRYGEAWQGGMLFWLFEELDEGDREKLGKDLVAKGVLTEETVAALHAGRGWGGKWLPYTTRKAQESTQYWAELANEGHSWAYVPGVLSSLWLPETAGTTVATLTGARVFPGLARIHPYIETGLLTTGTLLSSYEVGIHAQELITGKDPYTGRELTREEMLSSALLTLSSGLFLGAGFMSAPGTQQRMFTVRGQQFDLPPGFEVSPLAVSKFTPPGQKVLTPFAEEGVQYARHTRTGEVFEIRGTAGADEIAVTRIATGDRIVFGQDGAVRSTTRVPRVDVTTSSGSQVDVTPGVSVQSRSPSTALQTTTRLALEVVPTTPSPGVAGWWTADIALATRVDALEAATAADAFNRQLRTILDLQPDIPAVDRAVRAAEEAWRTDPTSYSRALDDLEDAALLAAAPVRNGVRDWSTSDQFELQDVAQPSLYARGWLEQGDLALDFTTRTSDGQRGMLRGRDAFERAMAHFAGRFTGIRGIWMSGSGPSDNLDLFNAALRGGKTMKEAAFATHTGGWARDAGFTNVEVLRSADGSVAGQYAGVVVRFTKASR